MIQNKVLSLFPLTLNFDSTQAGSGEEYKLLSGVCQAYGYYLF